MFPCFPMALQYLVVRNPTTGMYRVTRSDIGPASAPWNWAVCHTGSWIHRRHRYVWVSGPKRHHLEPVRWVKSGKKVGFVPIHPFDVKGRPPINRKEEVFAVSNKNGLSVERIRFEPNRPIESLESPPREFRNVYLRPLTRAEAPHMEAHAMNEARVGNKGTIAKTTGVPIRFDSKSQNFMMAKEVMHGNKSVIVVAPVSNRGGTLQGRAGSFAGGHGGSSVGSGSHSGGSSSGGGSHSGGGGGSSSSSSSGGSSSSAGTSSGGSSGGGGHR